MRPSVSSRVRKITPLPIIPPQNENFSCRTRLHIWVGRFNPPPPPRETWKWILVMEICVVATMARTYWPIDLGCLVVFSFSNLKSYTIPRQRPLRTETPRQRPPDRDPLDRDPLDRDPLDRNPPGQRPPWTETSWKETPWKETPWSCDLWSMLGQRPPCEQNHRHVEKHYLAATSLLAVITTEWIQPNWDIC